jgi:hypothetical protein
MSLTRNTIEEVTETINMAMVNLREAMVKVPDKDLGLKNTHRRFTESVGTLKVLLDEAHRCQDTEDRF